MPLCKLCDEAEKKTRAYVNCAKAGGIVCMEHCSECEYYMFAIGMSRCLCPDHENKFYQKVKEDLLKRVSPQSSYHGKP